MTVQLLRGSESPEGFILSARGNYYYHTTTSALYVKVSGNADTNTGWRGFNARGIYYGNGSPEGVIYAPTFAIYLDIEDEYNYVLYIQLNQSKVLECTGWIKVIGTECYNGTGHPSKNMNSNLKDGDSYVDTESLNFYIKVGENWISIPIIVISELDVVTNLSKLLSNEIALANVAYNLFCNPTPMDVSITQYDNDGKLHTITIPNRAKGFIADQGVGDPEGNVSGFLGSLYLDTENREPYIKLSAEQGKYGWVKLISANIFPKGFGALEYDPNTNQYIMHVDIKPIMNSENFLTSGTLYTCFNDKADVYGNFNNNFKVAYPVDDTDATNKGYVDSMVASINGLSGDVSNFATQLTTLSGRVNNVDNRMQTLNSGIGSSPSYIVETYVSDRGWYKLYSDGWCEQGGITETQDLRNVEIELFKDYTDINYYAYYTIQCADENKVFATNIISKTESKFTCKSVNVINLEESNDYRINWVAYGRIS